MFSLIHRLSFITTSLILQISKNPIFRSRMRNLPPLHMHISLHQILILPHPSLRLPIIQRRIQPPSHMSTLLTISILRPLLINILIHISIKSARLLRRINSPPLLLIVLSSSWLPTVHGRLEPKALLDLAEVLLHAIVRGHIHLG